MKKKFGNIVYHGTISIHMNSIVNKIDISKSNPKSDFGRGFYLTFYFDQALKIAQDRTEAYNDSIKLINQNEDIILATPIVIEYNLDVTSLQKLKELIFVNTSDNWVDFVYNNRIGRNSDFEKFDYIYGAVADTNLFPTIKQYKLGNITYKELRKGIQPYKYAKYDQLSVHTIRAIECLKVKSIKLGGV